MYEDFSFLDEATRRKIVIDTPNELADSIDVVKPIKDDLYTPNIEGANDEIRDMSYNNAKALYGEDLPEIVVERIEKELDSIIGNGFRDRKSTRLNSSHVATSYAVFCSKNKHD